MRVGSCLLLLPPTSRTLTTFSSLLTLAMDEVDEVELDVDAVVTCTGTITALFQLAERLRLLYILLIIPEMLLNV